MEQTPLKLPFSSLQEHDDLPSDDPSSYITVTCRLRPLLPQEEKSIIEVDKNLHHITVNDPTKSISKTYTYDRVFDETTCQDRFANTICNPLIKFLKNGGESGLIFSYGITNSGKTYTILGTKEQPGILLTLIKKLEQEFPEEKLRIFACELYKDEFMSLQTKGRKVQPKEFKGTISFDDCNSEEINESNMIDLFENFLQNRSCAATTHNNVSSRSHAIFKIIGTKFKIGVVDLAGSERASSNGDLKERIFINSSLLTLMKCIKALQDRSTISQKIVVPYRESKLTQALMEYFIVNSKINIIANVSQARHCLEQNQLAMDYTSKAKNIKANATNDFSKMMKILTSKKKPEASMLKPKTFGINIQEIKRYSEKILTQGKYIIDEEKLEVEEIEMGHEREIQIKERRTEMIKRQQEQMFEQIIESPEDIISDFIEKQRLFREVYLATDLAIQMEMDQRKLSALRKVNLMETTEKKEKPPKSEIKLKNPVQTFQFGTQILPGDLISKKEELEDKLADLKFDKLRTQIKNKLMLVLDEEKKKRLVDAETMWSQRKSQHLEKVVENKIVQKSVEEEEESNYTTPHKKNLEKSVTVLRKSKTISKPSEQKSIFKSIAKGAQSTYNGIKSCVKSGAKFITGFGKNSFTSQKPGKLASQPRRKVNFQAQRMFDILINPAAKLVYEMEAQAEIEIVQSSKKVTILEEEPQMNSDGQIEIDLPPKVIEKQVVVETYEVGMQTDHFELKHLMQDSFDQLVAENKMKNEKEKEKKSRKQNCFSSYSEDSTLIEESEDCPNDTPEKKPKKEKTSKQMPLQNPKTAFKNFSISRKDVKVSLKKQKALISNTKSAIAKHTRAAQRKKANISEVKN